MTATKKAKRRVNAQGRNVGHSGRFARLPHDVMTSNAYRGLTPNARAVLIEIISIYNGGNNGSLYLSVRDAAARMGVVDLAAASRALDDLEAMGFIQITVDAKFRGGSSETSRARCWRLTFEQGPGKALATHDYRMRQPEPKTPAYKRMDRGLRALKAYRKGRDCERFPVLDSSTLADYSPESG